MASSLFRGILTRGRTRQFLKVNASAQVPCADSKLLREYKLNVIGQQFEDGSKTLIFTDCKLLGSIALDLTHDASPCVKFVDRLRKHQPGSDYLYGAWSMIHTDALYETYSQAEKLKLMSRVLDVVQNYPQVDNKEIYELRIYVKTLSVDDGKENTTKKQISSRAVEVVQSSPLVSKYKVTNTSHFRKDLHLDNDGCRHIISALQMEFKIHLPNKIDSCKSAIDYIYDNLDERMPLEEFRNEFQYAPKSPSRS